MRVISLLKNKTNPLTLQPSKTKKNYETVSLKNIKKGSPFITLFPIKTEVLKAISDDMELNGFDQSQPVIIWKETGLLIDGHTRTEAAAKAGLSYVYAVFESFPDVDAALRYAYGLQFKRRNLTDADRFHFSETYLNNVGLDVKKSGMKKKELAEILSVSTGTAQKYISVLSRGTYKDQESVRSGLKTINTVYKSLLDREKPDDNKIKSAGKKATEKVDMNAAGVTITLSLTTIREVLDRLAGKKNGLKSDLYANREKIRGICELLPRTSEIRKYGLDLITEQEE